MSGHAMAVIMDHFRRPRNRGSLEQAHVECEDVNPGCGDRVRLQIRFGGSDEIEAVRFSGDGCVISMAAASVLTTLVDGRSLVDAARLPESVVLEALDATISPRRYDCALLAHRTLKAGLVDYAYRRRAGAS